MGTRQWTARRSAGVVAGLVIGGVSLGIGTAHAEDVVWGCPSGYTLVGTDCRGASGPSIGALGLLPGDADPVTGRILRPAVTPAEPTTPTTTPTTTTGPAPTSTTRPAPVPPDVRPCPRPSADVVRTAAAVDAARARLTADLRRGAPAAVLQADAQALAAAIREHSAAQNAQRPTAGCPVR